MVNFLIKKFNKNLLFVLSTILLLSCNFFFTGTIKLSEVKVVEPDPKISAFATIGPLWITNDSYSTSVTWEELTANSWCTGNGSADNPYILENITINAGGVDNCILVEDTNEHFIIRNCTLNFSGTIIDANAGVNLNNVQNGTIERNYFFDHIKYAIIVQYGCLNIKIQHNHIKNSSGAGIRYYQECNNTLIYNNTIEQCAWEGIYLSHYSVNNTIFNFR